MMNLRFLLIFMIIAMSIAGCSKSDNITEKDTVELFISSVIEGDFDRLNKLSRIDEEEQKEIITMVNKQKLIGVNPKQCMMKSDESLKHWVICQTTEDQQVFMTISLNKEKDGYFIYEFNYSAPYHITFRDDNLGLTDELIAETKLATGLEMDMKSDQLKNELHFELLNIFGALEKFFYGKINELISYIDINLMEIMDGEALTEAELIDGYLYEFMAYDSHTALQLSSVEVSSTYDVLEWLGLETKEDIREFNMESPFDLEDFHLVQLDLEVEDLYSNQINEVSFTIYTYMIDEQWKLLPIGFNVDPFDVEEYFEELGARETARSAEEIYQKSCMACHGGNLDDGAAPVLSAIGSVYSAEELEDIIENGIGGMPAQKQLSDDEREQLAAWLADKY